MKSNEAIGELCAAMLAECGAGDEFELDLGELVGKYRRKHDRWILDAEAARLLPMGPEVVAERQQCHKATAYRRAHRALKRVAHFPLSATIPA